MVHMMSVFTFLIIVTIVATTVQGLFLPLLLTQYKKQNGCFFNFIKKEHFFIGGGEGEITCGNGEVIDLEEGEEYFWYSPGWLEGDQYPKNIE